MAAAKKAVAKKKAVSAKQAGAVAKLLKGQKGGMGSVDNGPALPKPANANPVPTADDNDGDEE